MTQAMGQPIDGKSSGGNYVLVVGYPAQQFGFRIFLPAVFAQSSG
jgi:hypothetical protein